MKDVNFEILKKENIGIVGGNGSGKSTLLSLICGLLKPINGSIKIDNLDVGEHFDAYIKLIGYIPQNIKNSQNRKYIVFWKCKKGNYYKG